MSFLIKKVKYFWKCGLIRSHTLVFGANGSSLGTCYSNFFSQAPIVLGSTHLLILPALLPVAP